MKKKIFLALDNLEQDEILELVDELKDKVMFKLNDAFTKYGPELINKIHKKGGKLFMDLKFHDIPNTVSNYAKALCKKEVFMFNVHCLGGFEMMKKTKETVEQFCSENNLKKPLLIGVTILTSMNEQSLNDDLKIKESTENMVKHLALLAKKAGLDGVVCSPKEITLVKEACGKDFLTITPGIRPTYTTTDDQKRVLTPKQAIELGTDYIVIGRPITKAKNYNMTRLEAVNKILEEISTGH